MTSEERRFVLWGLSEGWSAARIGRALGVNEATVRRFRHRFLKEPVLLLELGLFEMVGSAYDDEYRCLVCSESFLRRQTVERHVLEHFVGDDDLQLGPADKAMNEQDPSTAAARGIADAFRLKPAPESDVIDPSGPKAPLLSESTLYEADDAPAFAGPQLEVGDGGVEPEPQVTESGPANEDEPPPDHQGPEDEGSEGPNDIEPLVDSAVARIRQRQVELETLQARYRPGGAMSDADPGEVRATRLFEDLKRSISEQVEDDEPDPAPLPAAPVAESLQDLMKESLDRMEIGRAKTEEADRLGEIERTLKEPVNTGPIADGDEEVIDTTGWHEAFERLTKGREMPRDAEYIPTPPAADEGSDDGEWWEEEL